MGKVVGPLDLIHEPRTGQPQPSPARITFHTVPGIGRTIIDIHPVDREFTVSAPKTTMYDVSVFKIRQGH
jgi:hypothetical protein